MVEWERKRVCGVALLISNRFCSSLYLLTQCFIITIAIAITIIIVTTPTTNFIIDNNIMIMIIIIMIMIIIINLFLEALIPG